VTTVADYRRQIEHALKPWLAGKAPRAATTPRRTKKRPREAKRLPPKVD
jgi:hypothetical protein